MKRKILAIMLAGALALQGSVWTAAAEEEILLVEDLGDSLLSGDAPAAEEEEATGNVEDEEIPGEDLIVESASEPEVGDPETAEVTIEELDLVEDPGYVQTQEEAEIAETGDVAINEENFPDEDFRKEYVKKFDKNRNGILEADEIEAVTEIRIDDEYLKITDLKGIEFFKSLTSLYCGSGYSGILKSLDVSGNPSLINLDCSNNCLSSLDVSGNPSLTNLNCSNNYLGSLDVSGNPFLTNLNCAENQLGSLDVSGNPSLTKLDCDSNQLSSLDVSGNSSLTELVCYYNQLSSLDVSSNPLLTNLECSNNQLSSLDVSGNPALTSLSCHNNQLSSLDVSGNPLLTNLGCGGNQLGSLDVSGNPSLTELYCASNQLGSLDVSSNPSLTKLDCASNQLNSLDVSGNPSLKELDCDSNQLSSLDVSGKPFLTTLLCRDNQLSSLDVSDSPSLTELWCHSNQLSSLDVSDKPLLTELLCNNNQLSSLDVSGSPSLEWLWCYDNQLKGSLDVSNKPLLDTLDCSNNQLSSLNASGDSSLGFLHCENNQLNSLDVSGCPALYNLHCYGNQLISLDLSGSPDLVELSLGGNRRQVPAPVQVDGIWQMNLADYVGADHLDRVTIYSEGASLSGEMVLFGSTRPEVLSYWYDTKIPGKSESNRRMGVTLKFPDDIECDEHDMVTVVDQEATCVTPGSQHRECKKCGYKEAPTEIPATGAHSFGAYVITKAATVLEEGTQTRKCSVCGKTESMPLAKLTPQIMVSEEKVTLKAGQTTKLEVSSLAEGDSVASWESNNKKVVKVDGEGKLTAQKKAGTAAVTITLASGLEKEIQVTVQKTKVETKKISGLPKTVTLKKGKKLTLKPVITPATSQDKVMYKSSDKKIATVSGKGVIKGKKAGKAKITVTSGKKKVTVTVKVKK